MAMDSVLQQLESKIEELVKAYQVSRKNETELAAKVEDLESKLKAGADVTGRLADLEQQRDELGKRLEKVLSLIDGTLAKNV